MSEESAPEEPPAGRVRKKRPFWIELPILLGIALVLTIVIQTFFARVFLIPSESMERTLHGCPGCYGDRVLVDKVVYWFGEPTPGEVVVFERPATWTRGSDESQNAFVDWLQDMFAPFGLAEPDDDDVVKRVIAVGGQTVECCDDRNRVLVDGKPLNEPYIFWDADRGSARQAEFAPVSVPEGMLFVMGDNRNNSGDSRTQGGGGRNGLVPVENVIGKARAIILPPSRWGGVGDDNPQAAGLLPAGIGLVAAVPVWWLLRRRGGLG
ncbi:MULTISPECIES: signal peptidase I [Actinokineospora]|uniref:Signal peptidase I n=1 Tax=Actinokineospora fastidiosa TaxID=1816 RepID=A0A918GNW8_9PSEU|nr:MULTISPECIES: signal peptidase I [Actinokineospora]UVS81117.1 Signal peptidase I [Actinokineospora sp. UTMC 2448]GGS51351.1 signal peptidase I [Actinokineospora fastidiosa]